MENILDRSEKRNAIIAHVAAKHKVDPRHLTGECRRAYTVVARWEAFVLIKVATGDAYINVGRFFKKDHSTVIYGIARYFGYRAIDKNKSLAGACDAAREGLALFGDQLKLEAELILNEANERKWAARRNNPLYAQLMGDRHAA